MRPHVKTGLVRTGAALLVGAAGASRAWAQCSVYRLGIPDFDQIRQAAPGIAGLPGNGACYCVPASAMNWLGYIANHGYPAVLSGARNWQSQANYGFITQQLATMGTIMMTDAGGAAGCGTSGANHVAGLQEWLDGFAPGKFTVSRKSVLGGDTVTPLALYQRMTLGDVANITVGTYTFMPANTPAGYIGPGRWVRTAGHIMSLARVYDACTTSPELWYRDPNGYEGDNFTQSPFITQHSSMVAVTDLFVGNTMDQPTPRTVWRYADLSGMKVLDAYTVINPVYALSASAQQGQVSLVGTWDLDSFAVPAPRTFNLPTGTQLLAMATHPAFGTVPMVLARSGEEVLWSLDLTTGMFTSVANVSDAMCMAFGRSGELYVPSRSRTGAIEVAIFHWGAPSPFVGSFPVPMPVVVMAYGDATDQIHLLLQAAGGPPRIGGADADGGGYMDEDLPAGVTIIGTPSLAVGPDQSIWVASSGVNALFRLTRSGAGPLVLSERILHPTIVDPRNLAVDHLGRLRFTSAGLFRALRRNAAGAWELDTDWALFNQAAGEPVQISGSRPGRDDWGGTPGEDDTDPPDDTGPGESDCVADFNGDFIVNSQDFFDFLNAFFLNLPIADVNFDTVVNSQDFFDFLTAFFSGCEV